MLKAKTSNGFLKYLLGLVYKGAFISNAKVNFPYVTLELKRLTIDLHNNNCKIKNEREKVILSSLKHDLEAGQLIKLISDLNDLTTLINQCFVSGNSSALNFQSISLGPLNTRSLSNADLIQIASQVALVINSINESAIGECSNVHELYPMQRNRFPKVEPVGTAIDQFLDLNSLILVCDVKPISLGEIEAVVQQNHYEWMRRHFDHPDLKVPTEFQAIFINHNHLVHVSVNQDTSECKAYLLEENTSFVLHVCGRLSSLPYNLLDGIEPLDRVLGCRFESLVSEPVAVPLNEMSLAIGQVQNYGSKLKSLGIYQTLKHHFKAPQRILAANSLAAAINPKAGDQTYISSPFANLECIEYLHNLQVDLLGQYRTFIDDYTKASGRTAADIKNLNIIANGEVATALYAGVIQNKPYEALSAIIDQFQADLDQQRNSAGIALISAVNQYCAERKLIPLMIASADSDTHEIRAQPLNGDNRLIPFQWFKAITVNVGHGVHQFTPVEQWVPMNTLHDLPAGYTATYFYPSSSSESIPANAFDVFQTPTHKDKLLSLCGDASTQAAASNTVKYFGENPTYLQRLIDSYAGSQNVDSSVANFAFFIPIEAKVHDGQMVYVGEYFKVSTGDLLLDPVKTKTLGMNELPNCFSAFKGLVCTDEFKEAQL